MRVLIFSTAYYPHVAGAEVAIKELTDRFSSDYTFDLITAKKAKGLPSFERVGSVNVYRMGFGYDFLDKWMLAKWGGWKAWRMHKKNHYDFSWVMMASFGGIAAWWFKVLCPKVPLVLSLQEGDDIATRKFGLVSFAWRLILKKVDQLTAISNYLNEEAIKYGYRGPKGMLVPNAVDEKRFEPDQNKISLARSEIRNKFNFKEDDTILVTTSRLVEKNANQDIISALKLLPDNIKFLLAGIGEEEKYLKNLVAEENLEKRVIFAGFVNQSDVPKYLWASDIFIRPSLSEGMGISFLEAMASHTPVIATRVGGIADFLTDGVTGFECKPHDPASIASAVTKIIQNREKTKQVIDNAAKLVRDNYDWNYITPKMEEAFKAVTTNQ